MSTSFATAAARLAALFALAVPLAAAAQTDPGTGLDNSIETGPIETAPLDEAATPPVEEPEFSVRMVDAPKARLRGLDTLTNTVDDFEIAVGETLAFKRLIVQLEACRYPEDDPTSEAYAYLHIRDSREAAPCFSGWMIASSPAFSALDHPRYDIWVLSCVTD